MAKRLTSAAAMDYKVQKSLTPFVNLTPTTFNIGNKLMVPNLPNRHLKVHFLCHHNLSLFQSIYYELEGRKVFVLLLQELLDVVGHAVAALNFFDSIS